MGMIYIHALTSACSVGRGWKGGLRWYEVDGVGSVDYDTEGMTD